MSDVPANEHVELHVRASSDIRSSLEIVKALGPCIEDLAGEWALEVATPASAARAYLPVCHMPVAPLLLSPARMFQNSLPLRDQSAPFHLHCMKLVHITAAHL